MDAELLEAVKREARVVGFGWGFLLGASMGALIVLALLDLVRV